MTANLNIIHPSIGRRVWFWPGEHELFTGSVKSMSPNQPMDAGVVFVWSDRMVNLSVTDHVGTVHAINSVTLVQPGDPVPPTGGMSYATWMDYQVNKAAAGA